MSSAFMLQSLALPCLVLAACLAGDREASGSKTELCWKPVSVMDSSRSSCTCHWLSSRLSRHGNEKGQAVCMCVCVSGGWRLQWGTCGVGLVGCTDWDVIATWIVYVWRREREGKGGQRGALISVSSSWEGEQVLLWVSQAPWISYKKDNTSLDPFPLSALISFSSLHEAFWFKETIDGSQVKMSVLSSLTSCLLPAQILVL